jgi:hypothetical protein
MTSQNKVVKAATRQADLINVVKVVLLIINALIAAGLILVAFGLRPSEPEPVTQEGVPEGEFGPEFVPVDQGTELWWLFLAQGVIVAVVGTLVILVIMGWFEHMLRTNTETTRLTWEKGVA